MRGETRREIKYLKQCNKRQKVMINKLAEIIVEARKAANKGDMLRCYALVHTKINFEYLIKEMRDAKE